jgi:heme/copper-type cytochrome/quinol oxidase subunit 2
MRFDHKRLDFIVFIAFLIIIVYMPIGIIAYDNYVWQNRMPANAKQFTLTGHTQKGWLMGEVQAYDVLSLGLSKPPLVKPAIKVSKGDRVVLKLKSSDVIHGFSLKDFGIFITDGIQPGRVTLVSFTADKIGTFTFSCNAICGNNHQNMQGTLIVEA